LESSENVSVIALSGDQDHAIFRHFFTTSQDHPRDTSSRIIFEEEIFGEVNQHHAVTSSDREGGGTPLV